MNHSTFGISGLLEFLIKYQNKRSFVDLKKCRKNAIDILMVEIEFVGRRGKEFEYRDH